MNLSAKNLGVGQKKIARPVRNFPKGKKLDLKSFSEKRTGRGFRSTLNPPGSRERFTFGSSWHKKDWTFCGLDVDLLVQAHLLEVGSYQYSSTWLQTSLAAVHEDIQQDKVASPVPIGQLSSRMHPRAAQLIEGLITYWKGGSWATWSAKRR